MLVISNSVIIPWHELQFQTMRAQGPGAARQQDGLRRLAALRLQRLPSLPDLYKEGWRGSPTAGSTTVSSRSGSRPTAART